MPRSVLILAHGQPSDPAPAEAELARLSTSVAGFLPGWKVGSATLAAPGALEAALAELETPIVFPFFMSEGWFVRSAIPERLAQAGAPNLPILPAFGLLDATVALAALSARKAVLGRSWTIAESVVVLAAHGSGRYRASYNAARAVQVAVADAGFADVRLGFIEEEPGLASVAANAGTRAICLPLFVARWGHVTTDVPAALASADFRGPCLAPLGARLEVPGIIATALQSTQLRA